jgi:hypothetical protein
VGAFERKLMTPSRFDAFLGGKLDALSDAEVAGLAKFIDMGCPTCHAGPTVGGLMLQQLGLVNPYETRTPAASKPPGRQRDKHLQGAVAAQQREDRSLVHDGSIQSLDEAIRLMAAPARQEAEAGRGRVDRSVPERIGRASLTRPHRGAKAAEWSEDASRTELRGLAARARRGRSPRRARSRKTRTTSGGTAPPPASTRRIALSCSTGSL